jgi:hypothetical protein
LARVIHVFVKEKSLEKLVSTVEGVGFDTKEVPGGTIGQREGILMYFLSLFVDVEMSWAPLRIFGH